MMATWFQGPRDDFIRVSADGFAKGVNILHFTGASQATLNAERTRAISQTRMTILQRGRARRARRRGVHRPVLRLLRQARRALGDRAAPADLREGPADPVVPGETIDFDTDLLGRYPEGYRYLAYLQVQAGYPVKRDMPGLRGPEVEALYARGAAWLAGERRRGRGGWPAAGG